MIRTLSLLTASAGLVLGGSLASAEKITGGGSTFIYPVLSKWVSNYEETSSNKINYQPIGSGGGIKALTSGTVTFAASDMPLHPDELEKKGWGQWPMITGGIVLAVHLPGIKDEAVVLDGKALTDIYMGKIVSWDHGDIQKLNPHVDLPNRHITVVHRSDGSGTTFNFTNYLSKVSSEWKSKVGSDTVVSWPTGVGGKGNAGVANYVETIPYSIGYVEYAYALQNNLTVTTMTNQEGKVVKPSLDSFKSAAANADYADHKDFYLILTDQPGDASWPIVATTFILMPEQPSSEAAAKTALDFMAWSYANGQDVSKHLDYVSIPQNVVTQIEKYWTANVTSNGQPVWSK
jgi:phosphate transport system substrate-binding protein